MDKKQVRPLSWCKDFPPGSTRAGLLFSNAVRRQPARLPFVKAWMPKISLCQIGSGHPNLVLDTHKFP